MHINDIKKSTAKNISYNIVGKFFSSIVQFLGNVIITRLLLASDFGIYSFATIINNLLLSFNDFGVNSALIRKNDVNKHELATALCIKAALGTLIALIAYAVAPLSIHFMDNSAIVNVIRVSSINFILSAFWLVP